MSKIPMSELPVSLPQEDAEINGMHPKHEVHSAFDTLKKAHEIRKTPTLLKAVKHHAKKEQGDMSAMLEGLPSDGDEMKSTEDLRGAYKKKFNKKMS